MRCRYCLRPIRRGAEERKRAEFWRQPDGTEKVYGENMPDGSLSEAHGTLVGAAHSKEYWAVWKRENRGGDGVLGTHPGLADPYAEEDE